MTLKGERCASQLCQKAGSLPAGPSFTPSFIEKKKIIRRVARAGNGGLDLGRGEARFHFPCAKKTA